MGGVHQRLLCQGATRRPVDRESTHNLIILNLFFLPESTLDVGTHRLLARGLCSVLLSIVVCILSVLLPLHLL